MKNALNNSFFLKGFGAIFRREINGYFATPLAYVFIAVYVAVSVLLAVHMGQMIEINRADLQSFFQFQPLLMVIFIPALGMKLWAEDFKNGTYEILFALPISELTIIFAKYCAGLAVVGLALVFCVPLWVAINILGNVDNLAVAMGFVGIFLMSSAFLAVTLAISAASKNQIIVFVISSLICFIFMYMGMPIVLNTISGFIGEWARGALVLFSINDYFDIISRGYLPISGLVFFLSFDALWLVICYAIIARKRGRM